MSKLLSSETVASLNEIDDLINRAKALSAQSQKKGPRNRHSDDIFIYQNRPVHTTDWSRERDVSYLSIYLPSKLPEFEGSSFTSIVLHSHTVFQPCTRDRYCHVFGWDIPDIYIHGFDHVWAYLYKPHIQSIIQLGKVDLSL